MNKKTPEYIATRLKEVLKKKEMNSQHLINAGINANQVYSVLRMGKPSRPNYSINTLLKVMDVMDIDFSDI